MKICFVCQGNIIRSPLAENLFRNLVQKSGLDSKYELDSAGTSAYHAGEPPDLRMRKVALGKGYEYSGRARQFKREDLDRFDLIIVMDRSNQRNLQDLVQAADQGQKIRLMREFDPINPVDLDVPDPYYGGPDGFEETFQIVERSCRGLFEELEGGQDPS
jgi:protein-tyrosine phosphatase